MFSPAAPLVVLFQGNSDYDSINSMSRIMAEAFAGLGYRIQIIDTRTPDDNPKMMRAANEGIAFCCSMGGVGLPTGPNLQAFFREYDIASLAYFLDPLPYVSDRALADFPRLAHSFTSANQTTFSARLLGRSIPTACLPHGAAARPVTEWADKDLDWVLVASTYERPEETLANTRRHHGEEAWQTCRMIIDHHDSRPLDQYTRPLEDMVMDVLIGTHGKSLRVDLIAACFLTVDIHLRNRAKIDLVRAMAGVKGVVAGRGWDGLDLPDSVTVLPEMPVAETVKLYDRARIVLNAQPPTYHSHERIYMAAAGLSVPATHRSGPVAEAMGEDAVAFFEPLGRDAGAVVADLLARPGDLAARAEAAHAAWQAGHQWKHRARAAAEFMAATFNCPPPPHADA